MINEYMANGYETWKATPPIQEFNYLSSNTFLNVAFSLDGLFQEINHPITKNMFLILFTQPLHSGRI